MAHFPTDRLDDLYETHVVIDLDTGTVLGTNLVAVDIEAAIAAENRAGNTITHEDIDSSDSLAVRIGAQYGKPILVEEN